MRKFTTLMLVETSFGVLDFEYDDQDSLIEKSIQCLVEDEQNEIEFRVLEIEELEETEEEEEYKNEREYQYSLDKYREDRLENENK